MTTRKAAQKIADHSAQQKVIARLSSRERLMRSIGPQITYVTAPVSGEMLLMRRPDIVALATNKDWPQPLTAAARMLITEGPDSMGTPERIPNYLDLIYRVVLQLACVEPAELIEARAQDEQDYEAAKAAWEAEHKAALKAGDEAGVHATTARTPVLESKHTDAALAGVDADSLRPLFVAAGKDADEDQMILLAPGDGLSPNHERGEFKFHMNDLYTVMRQLFVFQAGGLITFRG